MMGLSVRNLFTSSMPIVVLASPSYTNLHSCTVQGCWLCEVTQIKLDFSVAHVSPSVVYAEVEPLVMASCIRIDSHE